MLHNKLRFIYLSYICITTLVHVQIGCSEESDDYGHFIDPSSEQALSTWYCKYETGHLYLDNAANRAKIAISKLDKQIHDKNNACHYAKICEFLDLSIHTTLKNDPQKDAILMRAPYNYIPNPWYSQAVNKRNEAVSLINQSCKIRDLLNTTFTRPAASSCEF